MSTKPQRKSPQRIDSVQNAKLYNWLDQHKETFAKNLPSDQLATMAEENLGFKISESTITTLRKQMGIAVAATRGPAKTAAAQIKLLAEALVDTRRHNNLLISAELLAIAGANTKG